MRRLLRESSTKKQKVNVPLQGGLEPPAYRLTAERATDYATEANMKTWINSGTFVP
jgi:hypothetical protein